MVNDFVTWLTTEIDKRGWTNSELARRIGMAPSTISHVISGKRNPGWDFCAGVARAFSLPENKVFRRANLLSPLPPKDADAEEADAIIRNLSTQLREAAIAMLRGLNGSFTLAPALGMIAESRAIYTITHLEKLLIACTRLPPHLQEEVLAFIEQLTTKENETKGKD